MVSSNPANPYREPRPNLWLVALMFFLSLGVIAAAIAFLYHAFFADNPPNTTVVNPFFALLMIAAGGAGVYASAAAVFGRPVGLSAPPAAAPSLAARETAPAQGGKKLGWLYFLLGSEFKLWLLSLFLVGWGLWELHKQEANVWKWSRTEAVVLDSTVVSRYLRTNPPKPPLVPRLRYRYEVDGRPYESSTVTTGDPLVFATTEGADAFLQQHRVGDTISILYLPDAPEQSTLIVNRDGGCWILLGFGIPTLLLTLYLSWKRRGRSEPEYSEPVVV